MSIKSSSCSAAGYWKGLFTHGETTDDWQTGVEWVQVSKLHAARIYPEAMVKSLQRIAAGEQPDACYLGDVNR